MPHIESLISDRMSLEEINPPGDLYVKGLSFIARDTQSID